MPVNGPLDQYTVAQFSNTLYLFYTWYIAMIVLTRGTLSEDLCLYLHIGETQTVSFTTQRGAANNAEFVVCILRSIGREPRYVPHSVKSAGST